MNTRWITWTPGSMGTASRLSLENPGELESGSPRKREVSMRPGEALTTSESKGTQWKDANKEIKPMNRGFRQ